MGDFRGLTLRATTLVGAFSDVINVVMMYEHACYVKLDEVYPINQQKNGFFFTKLLFFETVKSKAIISLFKTVRLSVSISLRNLYYALKSIKEILHLFSKGRSSEGPCIPIYGRTRGIKETGSYSRQS